MPGPLFIVLNGPPYSGKTHIANTITNELRAHMRKTVIAHPQGAAELVMQDSFAAPMKHFISTILGVKYKDLKKDVMVAALRGYTPRQFLISLSEDHIKPIYGEDFYGRAMLHRVGRLEPQPLYMVVDDSGFEEEIEPITKRLVIKLTRPGCSYEGDSRNYLSEFDYELANDGTLDELDTKIRLILSHILTHPKNKW